MSMWRDMIDIAHEVGPALVEPLASALRDGNADAAAQAARVIAETIAFKRALEAARK